ncbi:hypothetical protein WJ50_01160 [Burkholderia ubonensis]|nr:hypothetical protein WI82_19415 [Burkholderia ubonensis]KVL86180.1 hypothetical protein WJ50_01160 [Burkholderia ubonensis]KVZ35576.1 hypothetical protein WL17_23540 [Burkholderia ubonensis]KWF04349.1 hypothetical protein WL83_29980 [Burkholderia ubonensis]
MRLDVQIGIAAAVPRIVDLFAGRQIPGNRLPFADTRGYASGEQRNDQDCDDGKTTIDLIHFAGRN